MDSQATVRNNRERSLYPLPSFPKDKGRQRMRYGLNSITDSMDMNLSELGK